MVEKENREVSTCHVVPGHDQGVDPLWNPPRNERPSCVSHPSSRGRRTQTRLSWARRRSPRPPASVCTTVSVTVFGHRVRLCRRLDVLQCGPTVCEPGRAGPGCGGRRREAQRPPPPGQAGPSPDRPLGAPARPLAHYSARRHPPSEPPLRGGPLKSLSSRRNVIRLLRAGPTPTHNSPPVALVGGEGAGWWRRWCRSEPVPDWFGTPSDPRP